MRFLLRHTPALVLGILAALLALSPATQAEEEPGPARKAPRTLALLVGCTDYDGRDQVSLKGGVNDVELMKAVLEERFGVSEGDITTLAGWPAEASARPTAANVRSVLATLAKRAYEPGDRVIVHYSGHGTQVPDKNGDELDGLDEAWVLADGEILLDEDIGGYLRAMRDRGASVWCVMDCCFAATGIRGAVDPEARTRHIDPKLLGIDMSAPTRARGAVDRRERSSMGEITDDDAGRLVAFYASQSFQPVQEVRLPRKSYDKKWYGLLTSAVVGALRRSRDHLSFGELYEQVVAGYRDLGKHHIAQPYAEGHLDQDVFTGGGKPVPLMVRKGMLGLDVSGGALQGLAVGTELQVYEPGSLGAGELPPALGRVRLFDVRFEASMALAVGADVAWAEGTGPWPAVVSKYVVGDTSLPLAFVDRQDRLVALETLPKRVRDVFDERMRARFPLVQTQAKARWVLTIDQGKPVAIAPAVRGPGAARYVVDTDSLATTLTRVYRAESLLKLIARDPGQGRLPWDLELRLFRSSARGRRLVQFGERIPPGTNLELELARRRRSGIARAVDPWALLWRDASAVDLFVFYIDPQFGIQRIWIDDREARFTKDELQRPRPLSKGQLLDTIQGPDRFVVFAAPARAGVPELRLDGLEQPSFVAARAAGSEAQKLLFELAFGTAGARGVDRAATGLFTQVFLFETGWHRIRIPKPSPGAHRARIERSAPPARSGAPPDAWDFGPEVSLGRAGDAWCLLVAHDAKASHALVDLDGEVAPARRKNPGGLRRMVMEQTFSAEIAIRVDREHGRTVVWYDTDHDGTFDLVLIDTDGDRRADERFERTDTTWRHDRGIQLDLLNTGYLTWITNDEIRGEACARLLALAGD